MDGHVSMMNWSETEKELRVSPELRAILLDVIGMDTEGELYQMEIQKKNTKNLPKRSRYYQGQIDFSKEFLDFMEYINATTDEVAAKSESDRIWRIHGRFGKNIRKTEYSI